MKTLFTTAFALAAGWLATSPASAQDFDARTLALFRAWSVVDVGGCHAVLNHGSVGLPLEAYPDPTSELRSVRWAGGCDANGQISGPGSLQIEKVKHFDGRPDSLDRVEYTGHASAGVMAGLFHYKKFFADEDGRWVLDGDDGGDFEWDDTFNSGCRVDEGLQLPCDPAAGLALQTRYLAMLGVSETQTTSASGSARGWSPPAPAPAAGRAPFANACLSLLAPAGDRSPGSFGANIWTLHNSCPFTVVVTWCARPNEASSWEIVCNDRRSITNEIKPNDGVLFPSTQDEATVDAFACRAPLFPQDVQFTDDRRLTSTGCPPA